MITILKGHISPETAYVVNDYPYGYKLRCKIRYWLEYKPGKGFRLVSQTTNPKSNQWNRPKPSTYCEFGACLYLDDENHVRWASLGQYSSAKEAQDFKDKYGEGVPEAGKLVMNKWVAAKATYEANRNQDDPLAKGLPEAHKAWNEAK